MRHDITVDARCLLRKPLEEARSEHDLALAIWFRLAIFKGNNLCQILLVLDDEVIPLPQNATSLATRLGSPCWECGCGCLDGGFGVLCC